MKKVLSILAIFATVCLFAASAKAKTVFVQEYDFNVLSSDAKKDPSCPSTFPYSEPKTGEGVSCARMKVGSKYCYKCSSTCNETNYSYTEDDCGDLEPDESTGCDPISGSRRYKSCKCPDGWYKKSELTNDPNSDTVFTYNSEIKTNKKGTSSCYQPLGCKSGKKKITSDLFSIKDNETSAQHSKDSCTSLKIKMVSKKNDSHNFGCAIGYSCLSSCAKTLANNVCADIKTDLTLVGWYDEGCKYYSDCITADTCVKNGASSANPTVAVSHHEVTLYDPTSNKFSKKTKCYYTSGCVSEVYPSSLFGASNLLIQGNKEGIRQSEQTYGGHTCVEYSCNSSLGYKATSSTTSSTSVASLQEDGKYEVAYVENSKGWFACRKENIVPSSTCYINCSVGDYYDNETEDCYKGTTASNYVYVSGDGDSARLLSLSKATETTIPSSDFTSVVSPDNLTRAEVESMATYLKQKFGAGTCFVTNSGVVLLNSDGSLTDITSEEEFKNCPPSQKVSHLILPLDSKMLAYSATVHSSGTIANAYVDPGYTSVDCPEGCAKCVKEGAFVVECVQCKQGYSKKPGNTNCRPDLPNEIRCPCDDGSSVAKGEKCPNGLICTSTGHLSGESAPTLDTCMTTVEHCQIMNIHNCVCKTCEDGYTLNDDGTKCYRSIEITDRPRNTTSFHKVIPLKSVNRTCGVAPAQCFMSCPAGAWYNPATKDCYTDGTMSNRIVLSHTGEEADLVNLTEFSNKTFSSIQLMNKSNCISKTEAARIAPQLLAKYGANYCFITSDGLVLLESSGAMKDITSKDMFAACGASMVCGVSEPLSEVPHCLERDPTDLSKCNVCEFGYLLVDGTCNLCTISRTSSTHIGTVMTATNCGNSGVPSPCNYGSWDNFHQNYPEAIDVYNCSNKQPCQTGCKKCNGETCETCATGYSLVDGKCHKNGYCPDAWDDSNICCSKGYDMVDQNIASGQSGTVGSLMVGHTGSHSVPYAIYKYNNGIVGKMVYGGVTQHEGADSIYLPKASYAVVWNSDDIWGYYTYSSITEAEVCAIKSGSSHTQCFEGEENPMDKTDTLNANYVVVDSADYFDSAAVNLFLE